MPADEPLPGYVDVKPMVFAGLFPTDADQYPDLRDALEKLKLNDGSLICEPETSQALGFGFRCGFLGLLHMDDRARAVRARVRPRPARHDAERRLPGRTRCRERTSRSTTRRRCRTRTRIEDVEEPYVRASVIVPKEYVGAIMELAQDRRGEFDHMEYLSESRVQLVYLLPLAEIVLDFYDQLKSRTRGYAAFDYELDGFRSSPSRQARHPAERRVGRRAQSMIVHRDKAYPAGKVLVDRLRGIIPRQMFDVPIQASIGSRIIARETIKAQRKDVLAKCYGGDVTRKRKLLEKQKKGKKRMKQVGSVEVPQEAFLAVLSLDGEK